MSDGAAAGGEDSVARRSEARGARVPEPVTTSPQGGARELRRELADARVAAARERDRWWGLFRLAPAAFVVSDCAGIVLEANAAAEELFDVAPGALAGTALATVVDPPAIRELLAGAGEDVQRLELRVRPRRRPPRRAEVAVRLLDPRAVEGGAAAAWSFLDIEEREAAREELRTLAAGLERQVEERTVELQAHRARLEAVLEGISAGVAVADARTGRIVQGNRHAERLVGSDVVGIALPRHDLRGFRLDGTLLSGDEWPLARALLRGESVRGERVRVEYAGGQSRVLEVNAEPIFDERGEVEAAVAIFWDATERERRERIERDFVTNAAHELQTPLAAIISAAEVLDAGAKQEPEARDRFLAHIRRECDRLARLVHALLTLARAQTRAEPPPVEELELRPLLDEIALALTPAAGVTVRVACPAQLRVHANRFLLEQAIAGLGGNAAKYTAAGRIWFRARRRPAGAVEIEVADEGPGISPAHGELLFDRFYRGGDRDATGFGLGLAIVRESVAALGGEVELRRRRPRGTSARILLPAPQEAS